MYAMFKNLNRFNQYIGDWDISKVIKMRRTFRGSTTFIQDTRDGALQILQLSQVSSRLMPR